jgi:hypothetical protein
MLFLEAYHPCTIPERHYPPLSLVKLLPDEEYELDKIVTLNGINNDFSTYLMERDVSHLRGNFILA